MLSPLTPRSWCPALAATAGRAGDRMIPKAQLRDAFARGGGRHPHGPGVAPSQGRENRHKDVKTTMIYLHVMNRPGRAVTSPPDRMRESTPSA